VVGVLIYSAGVWLEGIDSPGMEGLTFQPNKTEYFPAGVSIISTDARHCKMLHMKW
jgi:hypothetical protein